ncbi:MAG TPA: serine protease [Anaeromyxobacter sp.]|nr:serine protease [Anaeromyxobacter sp.]
MVKLESVSNPAPEAPSPFESAAESAPQRAMTPGGAGAAAAPSRSAKSLLVKGRAEAPLRAGPPTPFETVLGKDERVRILDTDLAPWRMICSLRIRGASGARAIGTGWFVGPRTILTAGHCVHSNRYFGGWATSIEVAPGRDGAETPFGTVKSARFGSVDRWVKSEDPDFDIGCIHLAEPLGDKVGWFAVAALPPAELEGFLVNVSGYPGDRGGGNEQYHHRNRVLTVTDRRVFYDVDTFGGQSGAPVWIHEREGAPPIAIGIHAYGVGGSPAGLDANSAPRIIPEVLEKIREWVEKDGGWPEAK